MFELTLTGMTLIVHYTAIKNNYTAFLYTKVMLSNYVLTTVFLVLSTNTRPADKKE